MPDTGAPWSIPYVEGTDLVADWPTDSLALANAVAAALDTASFDSIAVITATDATWSVPSLGGNGIVRVTCIGGGGGGGGSGTGTGAAGTGGTTTFAVGESFAVSASGGTGGNNGTETGTQTGTAGLASGNGGGAKTNSQVTGNSGNGGQIVTGYCDLTGETTLNLVVGAGGTGGSGSDGNGAAGGRGEIIVEYVAGA